MLDCELLIKNGTIVEGTRIPAFTGDIGINGGRITAMGNLTGPARGLSTPAG
jgi:N-acyl-D-amino-acid deacylase